MPAIYVAQGAACIVVGGKKERRIAILFRVPIEKPVYRLKQSWQIGQSCRILAAQVCLQVCHEKRARNSLTRDVGNHESNMPGCQLEEIVIIATHCPCLHAVSGVV